MIRGILLKAKINIKINQLKDKIKNVFEKNFFMEFGFRFD